jgi:electron transfer flavoprotein beta subunit
MSNVIVCYKWVKSEEDIRITPDKSIDLSKAKGKISDYDLNAIEAARLFAEANGSEVVGLTFGAADAKPSLKEGLSRGLKKAFWVNDQAAANADGFVTATVLAASIKKIGDYNLIVCSEGAADTYAHQVGPRLGALLDVPVVSFVAGMKLADNTLTAVRKLEHSLETVECDLPVIVTVLPEIHTAPIPGLKAILDAAKKPVTQWQVGDLGLSEDDLKRKTTIISFQGYTMARKNVIFKDGTAAEKVGTLVTALRKEGVL